VLIEQVDPVGARPLQGGVGDLLDVLRAARQARLLAVGVEGEAELGGDDDLIAYGLKGLTDEFLVDERPLHLGGVEQRDAALDGGAQQSDVRGPVGAVALAHAHRSETDGGDPQILAEYAFGTWGCGSPGSPVPADRQSADAA
jgi:hypothetical protein